LLCLGRNAHSHAQHLLASQLDCCYSAPLAHAWQTLQVQKPKQVLLISSIDQCSCCGLGCCYSHQLTPHCSTHTPQVVLKPSEFTPLTALALAELADRAGLPDGVLNIVFGDAPAIGG
jgi:hypothetical protein